MMDSNQMASQKERLYFESSAMEKTREIKRLAQVVPHRIDMPYFMSGNSAKLSERYQLDESDLEKLHLHAMSKAFRGGSSSRGSGNSRTLANTPVWTGQDRSKVLSGKVQMTTESGMSGDMPLNDVQGHEESPSQLSPFSLETLDTELVKGNTAHLSILSKKQKIAFEAMFNDIDFNSNGRVTFKELMLRMFSNVSRKDAKILMKIFDLNKDNTIDRREFVSICALNDRLCGLRTETKFDSLRLDLETLSKHLQIYKEIFSMLDQDGDEKILIDEIMLIVTAGMGREIGTNEIIVRAIIDAIDQDKHGYIDFISFLINIPIFLRLHESFMNSGNVQLRQLQQTKQDIRELLRSNISTPS